METRQPGKEIIASFDNNHSPISYLAGPLLPYLQLAIVITNNEGKAKEVAARIQPAEIDYYYPGFIEGTVIVTKSRSSYLTLMPTAEFDQLLAAYHDAIAMNAGAFGVLSITSKPKIHATS